MTQEEYIVLYEKHVANTCTAEERKLLFEHNDEFSLLDLPWERHTMGNKDEVKQGILKKLQYEIEGPPAANVFFLKIGF